MSAPPHRTMQVPARIHTYPVPANDRVIQIPDDE